MQKTMNLKGFVTILGIAVVVFLVLHIMLQNSLSKKTEKEKDLEVTLTRLEETNRGLKNQLERVGTEEYIVSSAIQDYSFMNKKDIKFEFDNPEALYAYSEQEIQILMDELAE